MSLEPDGVFAYEKQTIGADMRVLGVGSTAGTIQDPMGYTWYRPFSGAVNYYTVRALSGLRNHEYMSSEACDIGGDLRTTLVSIAQANPGETVAYDCLQRWHFPQSFECYGMIAPIYDYISGALKLKLGLFQDFPYGYSTFPWKLFSPAKFKIETTSTEERKLFIPPDPADTGRIIIPAGRYWLFIMAGAAFSGTFYGRTVRDYSVGGDRTWVGDRYRTFTATNYAAFNYASTSFVNDGTGPPAASLSAPANSAPWFTVDFAFLGRFI